MSLLTSIAGYWKLDESSGTAADQVNGNTLANINTVTYSAGKINNGANFVAASSQALTIANGSQTGLNITGDISIAGWFKHTTLTGTNDYSYVTRLFNNGSGFDGYRLYNSFSGGSSHITMTIGAVSHNIAQALSTATFYHIAVSVTGGVATFYVNGSSIGTASGYGGAVSNTGTFELGTAVSSAYMNGSIDEVGVWSRALSAAEITSLYNGGSGFSYPFSQTLTLTAAVGTFTLTGFAATLHKVKTLVASAGSYVLTGFTATLKYVQFPWQAQSKHTSSFSAESKNTSSFTAQSKTAASSWTPENKN